MLAPDVPIAPRDLGALLLSLWTAALLACCSAPAPEPPGDHAPGEGIYVPVQWQETRELPGHHTHVVEHQIPCTSCHELAEHSLERPTPQRCAVCHPAQAKIEHASQVATERFGAPEKADCTMCHVFRLDSAPPDGGAAHAVPTAAECKRCHGENADPGRAVHAHATSDCLECHRPHSDKKPTPHACTECHDQSVTLHPRDAQHPTQACTTCHQRLHGSSKDARAACAGCHAETKPTVPATALFDGGHRECIGCHRPHAGHDDKPEAPVTCTHCHGAVVTLAAKRAAPHSDCKSCHTPHDVMRNPDGACARCHTGVHPDHPKKGRAGSCVGCHDPHPATGNENQRVRPCSTCHQEAAADTAFHGGTGCRSCHAPHTFVRHLGDTGACSKCHGSQVGATAHNKGHGACESCHKGLPHRPGAAVAGCGSCHGAVAQTVRQGHESCRGCHEPHGGTVQKTCKSCHAPIQRSAPAGHQQCTTCHEQHSGSRARAVCTTCHARQAATPHGKIAGDCASCHRPHGPKGVASPPACTTCHGVGRLSGLHQIPKHQGCRSCHSNHGDVTSASRATCTSCHKDRDEHYPDAPECGSCHLFGKAR